MGPWGRFVENVSSKLAFFPPSPSSYEVLEHKDRSGELYIQPRSSDIPRVPQCKVKLLQTQRKGGGGGETIVSAFVPHKGASGMAKATLLCSHGNAVDLGQMLLVYRDLSRLLKVNVMGYDYSGYGASTGVPTVSNTLADIQAVFQSLQDDYGMKPGQIVLYGQSVGSGPTTWLASRTPDLAGVILHSPLLSGVRVLNPGIKWWPSWADVYPNHLLAPKIKAPVLVMHGTIDEVIHISCGKKLWELCPNRHTPLWAEGYTHQNVEHCPEFLPTLAGFIAKALAAQQDQQNQLQQQQQQGPRQTSMHRQQS